MTTHDWRCGCLPCRHAQLATAERHPSSFHHTVRWLEKHTGLAAYEAWRAEQPAHVFTDSEAPA